MTSAPLQQPFCTTRDAARLLGVSLRTAQLWAESGLLTAWKTEGGHRRITLESVEKLLAGRPSITVPGAGGVLERDAQPHILVAEDDPVFQELYQSMLGKWPLPPRVTLAGNGFDALIRIGLDHPDLLISDLDMPGMDGFEMLRAIRAMPEVADLAIIVVTGLSDADIARRHGVPSGVPVLHKPIRFDLLQEMATAILQQRLRGRK